MSHNHEHHHHSHQIESLNGIYIVSIVLNLTFVAIEAGVGFWKNSLGLLSDAGHNLSDVLSLVLALIAFKLAASHSSKRFTYGYRKSSVLISLINAVILLVAVGAIIIESIQKFSNPSVLDGGAIAWTAGIGIIINGVTAWMLMKRQGHDINTRGAYLHMAADTLVSVGVLASGLIIKSTGWYVIDPIISIVIAIVILISTWDLLKESVNMSIDAVPESIDIEEISEHIKEVEGVEEIHHLHIWPISTTETAMTAHVRINNLNRIEEINAAIAEEMKEHGISHITIQTETKPCSKSHCC